MYRPPSISDEGLQNHLEKMGLDYQEFNKRMKLAEPYSVIARAIGASRHSVKRYAIQWQHEVEADRQAKKR